MFDGQSTRRDEADLEVALDRRTAREVIGLKLALSGVLDVMPGRLGSEISEGVGWGGHTLHDT